MKKSRIWIHATVVAAIVGLLACSSTTFDSTWRAPESRPLQLAGKKVVAIFVNKNMAMRRAAEDTMAREISSHGAQGVPGYSILPDDMIRDHEKVKVKLEGMGFAGVVVMRVAGKETQVNYVPGTYYGSPYYRTWGGYWGYGWGAAYDPGYMTVDQVVKIETLVYSLDQGMLVWAGVSRTVSPSQVDSFISEVCNAAAEQMEKDGLLPKT
ncbi:MAG TPA: hypothetical protein VIB08_08640 [Thermoanaerobaculia bacterium]|jgi:hypothetical protein